MFNLYTFYMVIILFLWNLMVFMLYGIDKYRARKNKWRISERTLLLVAFLMGGVGALIAMNLFRHKTRHSKFKICVPISILLNAGTIIGFYYIYMNIALFGG